MHATRRVAALTAILGAIFAVVTFATPNSAGRTGATASASDISTISTTVAAGPDPALLDVGAVAAYVEGYALAVHETEAVAYQALIDQALAAQAAAAAPRASAPAYHPGTTVGDCTGFAIPDYIISRESGGNPSAYNPSGAYGCAQTLLSHYSRGSCQGLDPYSIDGQRACVDILSNGGTNLAPWAMTR